MKIASHLQLSVWIDLSIRHSLVNQLTHWNFKMPKIIILPHHEICPDGDIIEAKSGDSICDSLLKNHIHIEHACEKVCACTTCHAIHYTRIKQGKASGQSSAPKSPRHSRTLFLLAFFLDVVTIFSARPLPKELTE